ncbi:MAG TPA: GTPase Era [Gemmatimonadales bacterium]|nr:GTPase Era [Gemmatimonadales bacterium]
MPPPPTRSGHVALAGLPNVGKSSLLNALVGQHLAIVSPKAQATRLPVVGLLTRGPVQFVLHDLPGLLEPGYLMQARMRQAALQTLRQMHAVVHLHPAPDASAPPFRDLLGADAAAAAGIPVVTCYTKGDLVQPDARRRLEAGGAVVVSSPSGEGLPALLDRLEPFLPEGPFDYDPGDVGVQPLRFFVVEYLREAAFENLGDELPYSFAAEVEEFRENERPVYIRATLFVERESQKGMVVGKGGRMVKAIGQHARSRLEGLLGDPVYLDLRVKVLARWRRSASALTRFGFPPAQQESPP